MLGGIGADLWFGGGTSFDLNICNPLREGWPYKSDDFVPMDKPKDLPDIVCQLNLARERPRVFHSDVTPV